MKTFNSCSDLFHGEYRAAKAHMKAQGWWASATKAKSKKIHVLYGQLKTTECPFLSGAMAKIYTLLLGGFLYGPSSPQPPTLEVGVWYGLNPLL